MFESLKRFLKVYPLPIFVLLLSFVIYYSAFELIRKREINHVANTTPETEVDSMLHNGNQVATNTTKPTIEPITPLEPIKPDEPQQEETIEVQPTQEPQNEPIQTPKTYITTNTNSLNIRQTPSVNAPIVGKLTPTDQTILLEEEGEWIFIADATSEKPLGWIMKRFSQEITSPAPTQETKPQDLPAPITGNSTYVTSNVRSLNIRQEPNTTSAIIGKLTPSHKAVVLEERGEWILIGTFEDNKVLGWTLKSLTQELPQEVVIAETRNLTPTNTESQPSPVPTTPTNAESQAQNEQAQQTMANHTIQSTTDAPLYTSRVPSLNIRELPSVDTPIVGKLTPNDSVIIVETRDIWVRILDANTPSTKNGWVVRRSLALRQ